MYTRKLEHRLITDETPCKYVFTFVLFTTLAVAHLVSEHQKRCKYSLSEITLQ